MSEVFFLLNEALQLLLLILFLPLLFKLRQLLFLLFLSLLLLDHSHLVFFFFLGVFWAVHPLNMCLRLIIFVHKGHDFVELSLILSLLLSITFFGFEVVVCLHFSYFDGAKGFPGVLILILFMNMRSRLLPLHASVVCSRSHGGAVRWRNKIGSIKLYTADDLWFLGGEEQKCNC